MGLTVLANITSRLAKSVMKVLADFERTSFLVLDDVNPAVGGVPSFNELLVIFGSIVFRLDWTLPSNH